MSTTVPETTANRQEIERARQDMGRALFLLADRLAPQKLIPRLKETAKLKATEKLAELKEKVNPANIIRRKLHSEPKVISAQGYESNGKRTLPLPRGQG